MPTKCYLKNDLDVEFISTLAKKKIDTKTKGLVQYMTFDHFYVQDHSIWVLEYHFLMTDAFWALKVMYKNKKLNAFRLYDKMIRRISNPDFTKVSLINNFFGITILWFQPRRKKINGDMVPCELTDNFLIADSASDLVKALGDVIEEKLQGKTLRIWNGKSMWFDQNWKFAAILNGIIHAE